MTQDGALTIKTQCGAQEKTHSAGAFLSPGLPAAANTQVPWNSSPRWSCCLRKDRGTWSLWHSEDDPLPSPLWVLQLGFVSVCSRAGTSSPIHLTLGKGKAFPLFDKSPAGHWDGARQGGRDDVSWHYKGWAAPPQHSPSCCFSAIQGSSVPVCGWNVKEPFTDSLPESSSSKPMSQQQVWLQGWGGWCSLHLPQTFPCPPPVPRDLGHVVGCCHLLLLNVAVSRGLLGCLKFEA